jgi:pimeloyl-ACP methyl ester carboxylesterase
LSELLFDGTSLRVIGCSVDRPKLFVTFDHWRRHRASFPDYSPSKTALEHGYGHIYIQTDQNDWFLNQDTTRLRAFLSELCQGKESCSVGFSMGGYGALLFANALRLRRVLLLSPQYSIMHSKAPYEAGYQQEAALLDPALDQLEPLEDGHRLQGIIAYDPRQAPQDRLHADRIRALHPDLQPVALPFGGHTALKHMEGTGVMHEIMRAFIEDELSVGAIRGVHGLIGRDSSRYKKRLNTYLEQRRARTRPTPK